jgi:hypothetical protein
LELEKFAIGWALRATTQADSTTSVSKDRQRAGGHAAV